MGLEEPYHAAFYADRDRGMAAACRSGADNIQAVAKHCGVSRMTVSRAVKRREDATAEPDLTSET